MKTSTLQMVSIQVKTKEMEEWSDAKPVIHEVDTTSEGLVIAKAIAKQFDAPIRLTWPQNTRLMECKTEQEIEDYIFRLNGSYPNFK
jgi:hypothetical protein